MSYNILFVVWVDNMNRLHVNRYYFMTTENAHRRIIFPKFLFPGSFSKDFNRKIIEWSNFGWHQQPGCVWYGINTVFIRIEAPSQIEAPPCFLTFINSYILSHAINIWYKKKKMVNFKCSTSNVLVLWFFKEAPLKVWSWHRVPQFE